MPHKALFIDRDGIVNVDHGYVWKIEDFEFSNGILSLLKLFQDEGYLLFIITNQSGIGRGYYSEDDFQILTKWMLETLKKEGIAIQGVYHCPHTPDDKCQCRKPETGLIEQASEAYPINLKDSWMIGDKESDIQLAHNAGVENTIYIGDKNISDATLSFHSVRECKNYFQDNQDRILSKVTDK
ncbi:MAG: HAD family hydrolase [Campylobacterota bacterium]|nr:HAD family hydrolase [Campylobacterota bacterium]